MASSTFCTQACFGHQKVEGCTLKALMKIINCFSPKTTQGHKMLKDLCRKTKDAAAKIKDAKDVVERPKMGSKDVRSQRRICSFADAQTTIYHISAAAENIRSLGKSSLGSPSFCHGSEFASWGRPRTAYAATRSPGRAILRTPSAIELRDGRNVSELTSVFLDSKMPSLRMGGAEDKMHVYALAHWSNVEEYIREGEKRIGEALTMERLEAEASEANLGSENVVVEKLRYEDQDSYEH
ncbi:hypothetical protein K438DRAFT_1759206 [Mycena galopus ATCC 62051]|nr:hypothetical protein K438DRAFT_1759206 [Mycena galopus ATCC 62051]